MSLLKSSTYPFRKSTSSSLRQNIFNHSRKSPELQSALQSRIASEFVLWRRWQRFFLALGWRLSGTWSLIIVVCVFLLFHLLDQMSACSFPFLFHWRSPQKKVHLSLTASETITDVAKTHFVKAQCLWMKSGAVSVYNMDVFISAGTWNEANQIQIRRAAHKWDGHTSTGEL